MSSLFILIKYLKPGFHNDISTSPSKTKHSVLLVLALMLMSSENALF